MAGAEPLQGEGMNCGGDVDGSVAEELAEIKPRKEHHLPCMRRRGDPVMTAHHKKKEVMLLR